MKICRIVWKPGRPTTLCMLQKSLIQFLIKRSIVTKDADFHERILYRDPPPKVILFKTGNTSTQFLEEFLSRHWKEIEDQISITKLVLVFKEKIEGLK